MASLFLQARDEDAARPSVMVLGVGHWGNRSTDYVTTRYDDMLSSERQEQMREAVGRLKRFRPTKVALEITPDRSDELNEEYRRYRAGSFSLTANEHHQLGFRTAAELGHERIYLVDWQGIIGWDRALDFAREHGQAAALDELMARGQREAERGSAGIATRTVLEMLREHNSDPFGFGGAQDWYMTLAMVGEGEGYVGADVIANWYARNLKILANIGRITTSAEDRILVIIGLGHLPPLTHFIQTSGLYTLEPVEPYLSESPQESGKR